MFGWSNKIISLNQRISLVGKIQLIQPNISVTFDKFQVLNSTKKFGRVNIIFF